MAGDLVDDSGLALEARAQNDARAAASFPASCRSVSTSRAVVDAVLQIAGQRLIARSASATVSVSQKKSATSGR